MAECDPEVDFEFGLDLLIAGLRAKVSGARRPTPDSHAAR
jgi:hypothetical protein